MCRATAHTGFGCEVLASNACFERLGSSRPPRCQRAASPHVQASLTMPPPPPLVFGCGHQNDEMVEVTPKSVRIAKNPKMDPKANKW